MSLFILIWTKIREIRGDSETTSVSTSQGMHTFCIWLTSYNALQKTDDWYRCNEVSHLFLEFFVLSLHQVNGHRPLLLLLFFANHGLELMSKDIAVLLQAVHKSLELGDCLTMSIDFLVEDALLQVKLITDLVLVWQGAAQDLLGGTQCRRYRKGTSIWQAPVFQHLSAFRKSPWKFIIWMNEL